MKRTRKEKLVEKFIGKDRRMGKNGKYEKEEYQE